MLVTNFKNLTIKKLSDPATTMQLVSSHINEFIKVLFTCVKEFYKFKTVQDHQKSNEEYETILRSQIDVLLDVCKEVVLDQSLT